MPRKKVNPRYRVVSVRLSESEHTFLKDFISESKTSISELMRQTVAYLMVAAPAQNLILRSKELNEQ